MHLSTSYDQSVLDAASLLVDCAGYDNSELRQVATDRLARERAVYLRNTGMTALHQMSDWASFLGIRQMDYEGGTGSRFEMGAGVLSVGTEPAHTNIDPHSEMAYWQYYPQYVMFGCEIAPRHGGETVIASNERVSAALEKTPTARKIFDTGIRYVRNFADRDNPQSIPSTSTWQDNFDTDSWDDLERHCAERSWRLERRPGGSARVSWLEQGYEFDQKTGRHLLFTSLARLGRAFDEWPPFDALDNEDRPYHVSYADGSQFSARDLANLDQAFARYTIPLQWRPGDIALLENIAWTHSRPPYRLERGEQRKIGILVSDHQPRLRQQSGARV